MRGAKIMKPSNKQQQQLVKSIKKNRRNRIIKIIAKSIYLNRMGNKEDLYTYVCDEFTMMGGVYVKFLQGVLLRSEVMRNWHNPDKLKIFEDLDPVRILSLLLKLILK